MLIGKWCCFFSNLLNCFYFYFLHFILEPTEHSDQNTESIKLKCEASTTIQNVAQPVVTMPIRVRHPPGGRSSGIF